jgi:hypothetical protein
MVEAYHQPVALGWGWWLTVVGIILSIIGGVWAAGFERIKRTPNYTLDSATDLF